MLYGQIECFLAVARLGNLSRAAEEMFLTQPTLTARLKALEEEVGDQLFARTSRGMRLTEAGKEFLPYAERAVGSFEEGKRRLKELRGASGGRLLLGAAPGVGTYALPGLLERFTAAYPRVTVSVRTGHSEDILEMVLKEEVQLGLTRAMRHPEIESLHLYDDELVLVVDPGHRFTEKGQADLAEIEGEQLILFDNDSSYYEQTQALFRNAGIREFRKLEVDNIEAAKRMVEHRLGVAFLPRTAIVRSVSAGNLALISVKENPGMTRSIVALKRRDVPASGPVSAFLEVASTLGETQDRAHLSPTLAAEFENLQLIDLFTPGREEIERVPLEHVPVERDEPFLDVGCGQSCLSEAVLREFPSARVLASTAHPRCSALRAARPLRREGGAAFLLAGRSDMDLWHRGAGALLS